MNVDMIRLTPRRREWLEKLASGGEASPDGWATTPYWCKKAGWSSWVYVSPDGRRIDKATVRRECPHQPLLNGYEFANPIREMITEAGRMALAAK